MALVRIRLIDTREGIGKAGELMEVSPERAERWTNNGIASLVEEARPKTKPAPPKIKSNKWA